MSIRDQRYESILFNYETTGRTDYREGAIKPIIKTKYEEKSPCLRIRPPPLKDLHALTDWKTPNVPFNLMHRPKDIVQTDPRKPQEPYYHPVDLLRKEAQMTRPRLIMTPAVCVDDLDDSTRGRLIEDMYTTTLDKMALEARIEVDPSVRSPLTREEARADATCLPRVQPPPVPREWRMDSIAWDSRQVRSYCDATKNYWRGRLPNGCGACKVTADLEAKEKMRRLAKRHH